MTQAPPPYPPPGQPYQQAPAAQPAQKPIFKKWWFWVGLIVVLIIIAGVAGGGDDDNSTSSAPAATSSSVAAGGDAGATDAVETTEAAPAPEPADDPLSDGDWTASDIQVENSQFGTSLTARVTNNGDDSLSGLFTVTVFDAGGARIGNFQGSANNVEPGSASTVTFIGTTDTLEGDPATYTYEFEDNGSY